jgi:hypothetical protein
MWMCLAPPPSVWLTAAPAALPQCRNPSQKPTAAAAGDLSAAAGVVAVVVAGVVV